MDGFISGVFSTLAFAALWYALWLIYKGASADTASKAGYAPTPDEKRWIEDEDKRARLYGISGNLPVRDYIAAHLGAMWSEVDKMRREQ